MKKSVLFFISFILAYLIMCSLDVLGFQLNWVEGATFIDRTREYLKIGFLQEFGFKIFVSLLISFITIIIKGLINLKNSRT